MWELGRAKVHTVSGNRRCCDLTPPFQAAQDPETLPILRIMGGRKCDERKLEGLSLQDGWEVGAVPKCGLHCSPDNRFKLTTEKSDSELQIPSTRLSVQSALSPPLRETVLRLPHVGLLFFFSLKGVGALGALGDGREVLLSLGCSCSGAGTWNSGLQLKEMWLVYIPVLSCSFSEPH